jgi:hypothetical protein
MDYSCLYSVDVRSLTYVHATRPDGTRSHAITFETAIGHQDVILTMWHVQFSHDMWSVQHVCSAACAETTAEVDEAVHGRPREHKCKEL